MKADTWLRIRELFPEAARLRGPERARYLESSCAGDAELLGELHRLLASEERPGGVLETLAGPFSATAWLAGELPAGTRLGHFRLLRVLDSGGMGRVWLGEQDEPRRMAAVKVLHAFAASPAAVRRFRDESAILARLQHPGIAQVYQAGSFHPPGAPPDVELPWFALEHVEGAHDLLTHADERCLSRRARLDAFLSVCDAVQHAHEKGVIHRDLKARNVLVGDAGVPKVIDFGVARVLAGDSVDGSRPAAVTRAGEIVGTLTGMAPEQLSGDPEAVDTRTDVHALGLLLYELLCGASPYQLEGLDVLEVARTLREIPPRRPSALRPELTGDLEWILLRALEKEPARRYSTAGELAADLRRHLDHEPVLAAPPGLAYRARKLLRRHRVAVLGIGAALVALFSGLSVGLLRARAAEAEARLEAVRSGKLVEYMREVLHSPAPEALGIDTRMVDVLGQAVALAETLSDEPGFQGAALGIIGRTYQALGMPAEAEPLLTRAVELHAAAGGASSSEVLVLEKYRAMCIARLDRPAEAEAALRALLPRMREAMPRDGETVSAMLTLADVLLRQRRFEECADVARDAQLAGMALVGPDDPLTLRAGITSGEALIRLGRHDEAAPIVEDALERARSAPRPHMTTVGLGLWQLAELHAQRGEIEIATGLRREVVELRAETLGPDHPSTCQARNELAMSLDRAGHHEEAEELFRAALSGYELRLGRANKSALRVATNLAPFLSRRGRHDEALAVLDERAQEVEAFGQERIEHYGWHRSRSLALVGLGRRKEAEQELLEACAERQEHYGSGDTSLRDALRELERLYRAWDRGPEADAIAARLASATEPAQR